MGKPYDIVGHDEQQRNAMAMWKARQANRPVQGPPTEIQMLRDEVAKLKQRQADNEMAQALSAHEATRLRF